MLSRFKSTLVGCLTLLAWTVRAQDVPLSVLPMQFNGSFAGEASSPRVSTSFLYRTRPELQPIPNTQMAAAYPYRMFQANTTYDQFMPALRSGVGIATSHSYGYTAYRTFRAHSVTLAVAPKFSVRGKYTFSPSLDVEYGRLQEFGKEHPVVARHGDHEGHWVRGRAGVLFNTNKYYIGYSAVLRVGRHSDYVSHLQLGYTFGNSTGSKFSFTPQLALRIGAGGRYSPHSSRDTGTGGMRNSGIGVEAFSLGFRYRQFLWGVNNVGLHVGWQAERLRVMLTNNVGLIRSYEYMPYTGNLSLRYVFKGTAD